MEVVDQEDVDEDDGGSGDAWQMKLEGSKMHVETTMGACGSGGFM